MKSYQTLDDFIQDVHSFQAEVGLEVSISEPMTKDSLLLLATCISAFKQAMPIVLCLHVNVNLMEREGFKKLALALKDSNLKAVKLCFMQIELDKFSGLILTELMEDSVSRFDQVNVPVLICNSAYKRSDAFNTYYKRILRNLHIEGDFVKVNTEANMQADVSPESLFGFARVVVAEADISLKREDIKARLRKLFSAVKYSESQLQQVALEYREYLSANMSSLKLIRSIHEEFLTDFLKSNELKHLSFFRRWFGFERKLNKIASDVNYLLLFKAFADVNSNPAVEFNVIQNSVLGMLQEYYHGCWFVSVEKKSATMELMFAVRNAKTINDLVGALSVSKSAVMDKDLFKNKSFLRIFKPVNFLGSRFQNTVDNALALTAALSGESYPSPTIAAFSVKLKSTVKNKDVLTDFEASKSLYCFNAAVHNLKFNDSSNGKVITKSIGTLLRNHGLHRDPNGLFGQKSAFQIENVSSGPIPRI